MESIGGLLFPLFILLLFVPIFLSGRKQRAQMQQMQQLQSALEVGDVVTTTSGLRGTVVDASYQDTVDLEIADGVVTTWLRAAVREKVADVTDTDDTAAIAGTGAADTAAADPATGTPAVDGSRTTGAATDERAPGRLDADRTGPAGGDGTASTAGTATGTAADTPATSGDANGSHRS